MYTMQCVSPDFGNYLQSVWYYKEINSPYKLNRERNVIKTSVSNHTPIIEPLLYLKPNGEHVGLSSLVVSLHVGYLSV